MAGNKFKPKKHEDFEIVDSNGKKVGSIRLKPSGILWKPKGVHSWSSVALDTFAQFMEENGKTQTK